MVSRERADEMSARQESRQATSFRHAQAYEQTQGRAYYGDPRQAGWTPSSGVGSSGFVGGKEGGSVSSKVRLLSSIKDIPAEELRSDVAGAPTLKEALLKRGFSELEARRISQEIGVSTSQRVRPEHFEGGVYQATKTFTTNVEKLRAVGEQIKSESKDLEVQREGLVASRERLEADIAAGRSPTASIRGYNERVAAYKKASLELNRGISRYNDMAEISGKEAQIAAAKVSKFPPTQKTSTFVAPSSTRSSFSTDPGAGLRSAKEMSARVVEREELVGPPVVGEHFAGWEDVAQSKYKFAKEADSMWMTDPRTGKPPLVSKIGGKPGYVSQFPLDAGVISRHVGTSAGSWGLIGAGLGSIGGPLGGISGGIAGGVQGTIFGAASYGVGFAYETGTEALKSVGLDLHPPPSIEGARQNVQYYKQFWGNMPSIIEKEQKTVFKTPVELGFGFADPVVNPVVSFFTGRKAVKTKPFFKTILTFEQPTKLEIGTLPAEHYPYLDGKAGKAEMARLVAGGVGLVTAFKFPGTRISSRITKGVLDRKFLGAYRGAERIELVPSYTVEQTPGQLKSLVGQKTSGAHASYANLFPGRASRFFSKLKSGQVKTAFGELGKSSKTTLLTYQPGEAMGLRSSLGHQPFYFSAPPPKDPELYRIYGGYIGAGKGYSGSSGQIQLLPATGKAYLEQSVLGYTKIRSGKGLIPSLKTWWGKSGIKQVDPMNLLGASVEGQHTVATAATQAWAPPGGFAGSFLTKEKYLGYGFFKETLQAPVFVTKSKLLTRLWESSPLGSRYQMIQLYKVGLSPVAGAGSVKPSVGKTVEVSSYPSSYYSRKVGRSISEVVSRSGSAYVPSASVYMSPSKAISSVASTVFVPFAVSSVAKSSASSALRKITSASSYNESLVSSVASSYVSSPSVVSSPSKSVSRYSSPYPSIVSSYISPSKSVYKSPYRSPYQSPYKSPYRSPYSSPYTSPYRSPYSSPYSSPYTSPYPYPFYSKIPSPYMDDYSKQKSRGKRRKRKPSFIGQVRRRGKWIDVSPATYKEVARQFAASVAIGTPARSMRVIPSKKRGKKAKAPSLPKGWEKMFRLPKSRVLKGAMVEKSKYGIDEPGEYAGITLKGLEALALKPSKRKKKKHKRKKGGGKGKAWPFAF